MPLSLKFYVDTDMAPDDVLQIVADDLGFKVEHGRDAQGYQKNSLGPGFLVCAYATDPDGQDMAPMVREGLGVDPKVIIDFYRLTPESPDEPNGTHMMLKGAQAVCRALPGDAVFLFNAENVWLLKKDGVLYVNSKRGWRDYSIFQQPYVLKDIDDL